MVHVNADGSHVFIPYAGEFDRYARRCDEIAASDYRGFRFGAAVARDVSLCDYSEDIKLRGYGP